MFFTIFYNKIFSITFDQNFSKATGIKTDFYNTLISILTAVTIVVGMRIMGTMLISSLVIFPTLTSMRLFKSFKSVVISSAIISIICFTIGIIVSYIMNFPAGASIVAVNLVAFIVFVIIGKIRG